MLYFSSALTEQENQLIKIFELWLRFKAIFLSAEIWWGLPVERKTIERWFVTKHFEISAYSKSHLWRKGANSSSNLLVPRQKDILPESRLSLVLAEFAKKNSYQHWVNYEPWFPQTCSCLPEHQRHSHKQVNKWVVVLRWETIWALSFSGSYFAVLAELLLQFFFLRKCVIYEK